MFEARRWYLLLAVLAVVLPLAAQPAISTKAGLLNYFEGQVLLDGQEIEYNLAKFPQMPPGSTLEAASRGRAEVLLSPGVMLWVGEGAKIQLVSDDLVNPVVRLLAGNTVLSSTDFPKEAAVTMLVDESSVTISDGGIYRFDADPARLEVQDGKASVTRASVETLVKKGRALMLDDPNANLARIDKNESPDSLLLWAETRDNYIHMANLSAARQAELSGGFPGGSMGMGMGMGMLGAYQGFGGWMFNPYFGMFTLVPFGNSMMMSPFGNMFWSPFAAQQFFYTPIFAGLAGGGGQQVDRRAMNSRNSIARGGFSNNAAYGNFSRGISVQGGGGVGRGGMSPGMPSRGYSPGMSPSRGSYGGGSMGRGSVGGGGGAVSAPSTSGGASMGRGGSSAGRSGGGGGRN